MDVMPIFQDHLDLSLLVRYVNKELSEQEIIKVELLLESNSLYQEALEGALLYSSNKKMVEDKIIPELNKIDNYLSIDSSKFQISDGPLFSLKELLDLFKPVPFYEELLEGMQVRSQSIAEQLTQSISVVSPPKNSNLSNWLVFTLNQKTNKSLFLTIENNQEQTVYETAFNENSQSKEINILAWKPGCYYWRLILDTDEFLFGKFYKNKELLSSLTPSD